MSLHGRMAKDTHLGLSVFLLNKSFAQHSGEAWPTAKSPQEFHSGENNTQGGKVALGNRSMKRKFLGPGMELYWQNVCRACTAPEIPSPAPDEPGRVGHTYSLTTWVVEAARSRVQSPPQSYIKFRLGLAS